MAGDAPPRRPGRPVVQDLTPDIHYQPTPMSVVQAMLDLAAVGPADRAYDLGCGDGRVVIEAARRGAMGVGVEVDGLLVARAREGAKRAGVESRAVFRQENLFDTDLREATVVLLFISADMCLRLRPRLMRDLAPGARIVSHMYRIGDWAPAKTAAAKGPLRDHPIYLWTLNQAA